MDLAFNRVHPEDVPGVQAIHEKAFRERSRMDFEHRLLMAVSLKSEAEGARMHSEMMKALGISIEHEVVTVTAKNENGLTLERGDDSRSFFDPQERSHFDVGLSRRLPVARGEKLLVRANFAPGKLRNGDLVTVGEVKSDGSLLLQDGRTIPSHFRQFTHGYEPDGIYAILPLKRLPKIEKYESGAWFGTHYCSEGHHQRC